MAEYFEAEAVVKDYDGAIVGRIFAYLKPYRLLAVLAALALAGSTLGELLIPVIQQRVIDDVMLARSLALRLDMAGPDLSSEAAGALETLRNNPRGAALGEYYFIPPGAHPPVSRKAEEELRNQGVWEPDGWYVFSPREGDPAWKVIHSYPGRFLYDGAAAAIRAADLYALPVGDIRIIRGGDLRFMLRAVLALLVLLLLVFGLTFTQTWITSLLGQRVMKDIRLALFQKTAGQSTGFLSRHPVGRMVTRITADVETINDFFTSVLAAFLKDLAVMAGVLITLLFLSPKLALVVLATMPPVIAVTAVSRLKARDAFRRQRIASSQVNSYLSERLSGIQAVQLFQGERKSAAEFSGRNRELLDANLGEMYVFATFRPLVEWFASITTGVIIGVGANMVLNLSLSLGVLIAFINLTAKFYTPLMDIAEKYTLLQSAMAGGERIFALLDTEEQIPDTGKRSIEGRVRGHIVFEDVHFSYDAHGGRGEVLKGLSFTVHPGETAAIVGYTGAGKTTITNVLARLWDIDSGIIRLDGIPIQEIPLKELRRSVLPVLQDVFLFSGTVAENISLGLPLENSRIEAAARAVHAHAFISRLPKGYQTELSEGAANISAGQRQLISFARVIAHDPAIVILDEATSSIDTETERLIRLGIQRVLAGRASLVIAHRLSTIRHADRILVLSDGRLAEQGKHDELIRRNGLYARLYKLQYEGIEG
ncbi:MAG: ABC transporter ATP-binding protein/permease [Treponema sp.]|nr:ABC transporter ATP-binding protein/permease [Treponema sp.]